MPLHGGRLYGAHDIERHCKPQIDRHHKAGRNSIADQPHTQDREIARHRRQRERKEAKHV